MFNKLIKFIFRKKSLNSAIYILVAAIIRESIALGYDESFEELFIRLSERYDSYEVNIIILVLQIIFTKGSYITLSILIGVFLIILFVRYRDNISVNDARPRIDFHKIYSYSSRKPLGFTKNNPKIIRFGIDKIEQQWELEWRYKVEVRNNSTVPIYEFRVEFENKPPTARLRNDIGKFEPIKVHEKRELEFSIVQLYVGYHDEVDKMIGDKNNHLLDNLILVGKYKNENRQEYSTRYIWSEDLNIHE